MGLHFKIEDYCWNIQLLAELVVPATIRCGHYDHVQHYCIFVIDRIKNARILCHFARLQTTDLMKKKQQCQLPAIEI
jgi:hypothetical protein